MKIGDGERHDEEKMRDEEGYHTEAASTQKGYYLTNYLDNYLTYYRVSK